MKFFKLPELYCILLLVASVALSSYLAIKVENVTLHHNGTEREIPLPYSESMQENERFKVELDVADNSVNYSLRIIPDDCMEKLAINGSPIDVDQIQGHCDYSKGFLLSDSLIAAHRESGTTHFTFNLRNGGGNAGINVFAIMKSPLAECAKGLACVSLALLCAFVARRLKFSRSLIVLLFVGVLFRAFFFADTPYTAFAHDVDGHVDYVEYILEKHSIPGVDDCWTCYHPPVYYVASSPTFVLGEWLGVSGTSGLQAFSLLLSVVTLFLGVLFLRSFLVGTPFTLASLLWTLWPLMILVSPRIGNDQMFYMFHVLCLWSGASYLNSGRGKFLIVAVIATALAIWTKSSGAITLGMLILFAVCGYVENARHLSPTRTEVIAWVMLVAVLLGVVLQKLVGDADLVGNSSGLHSKLRVGNEAVNYIFFDLKTFITQPFTNAWDSDMGREYFWNYALKTSLFGEFSLVPSVAGRNLAAFVSVSFLGLVVYAVRGFWKTKLHTIHWLLLVQAVAFFAALMFLRIQHPYSCSNDFRYIVPVILSFVPFVAWGVTLKRASTKWTVLGYALTAVFVACSAILYILAV